MSGLLARLVLTSRATLDTAGATRTQVVSRQRGGSALNPEISATGDFRLIGQRHGDLRGETPEVEVALQSTLDPYSTAKFIVGLSSEEVAVEEGYLYYTGLPGRLRADLGLIRQQVGDLNRWHLHALPESEYPLVYQRFLSPEGLSGAGLSLYHRIARFAAPWHPRSLVAGDHRRE